MKRARASALLSAAAALPALGRTAWGQSGATIRIAPIPTEGGAEAYYARDAGFFAAAGLTADVQTLPSSSAVAAAVASNSVDVGYGNIDVLAALTSKHIPTIIVAPANEYVASAATHIAALLVAPASSIRTAKDLGGKTVAIGALHSTPETATRAWVDANGGDSTTVKFVEVPIPAIPAALGAGRVDAAFVSEPFFGVAAKTNRILAYPYDGVAKHFLLGAWFATPQWAKEHPDVVNRFALAIRRTAAWANTNLVQSGTILAKYSQIDPAVIATITRARFGEQLSAALVQPLIDASAKYNGFDAFPAQELIYSPAR